MQTHPTLETAAPESRRLRRRLRPLVRTFLGASLLAPLAASALLVQPFLAVNKLRLYPELFPVAPDNPVQEVNLIPDVQAAWSTSQGGPNAVACYGDKMFVSFDIGFSKGGVLVYDLHDVYPVRNSTPPAVLRPGKDEPNAAAEGRTEGRICFGIAVHPDSGDLYVGSYNGGVYKYTAASGYSQASETVHAPLGAAGGGVKNVCANLAFDSSRNLWFSTWDIGSGAVADHLLVCLKGNNLATAYTVRSKLNNGAAAYAATIRTGGAKAVHLFSAPEGIAFDFTGNLWCGNNNDFVRTNAPGDGTICKISGNWIFTMLAAAPGNFEVPSNEAQVLLIPNGKPGGVAWLGGPVGLLINDQGNGHVWRYQTGVPFNEGTFYSSGIPTDNPGNGTMGLLNESALFPQPTETDLAYSIAPVGSYIKGASASFQITLRNVGTQAIPAGVYQYCGVYTVFGPGPPTSVTPVGFSGQGWFGTLVDGVPVARNYRGLAPGQSYPPLTFTFRIGNDAQATAAAVAIEGYGPNEIELSDNLAALSVPTREQDPIERFRIENFGDAHNVGAAADNAAPAGDGLPNLMKFALGLDPNLPAVLDERVDFVKENDQLALDIAKNPAAEGLNFVVERTTNLADPGSWTTNGVTVDIDTSSRLKATLNQSLLTPGAVFMRLRVLAPGP